MKRQKPLDSEFKPEESLRATIKQLSQAYHKLTDGREALPGVKEKISEFFRDDLSRVGTEACGEILFEATRNELDILCLSEHKDETFLIEELLQTEEFSLLGAAMYPVEHGGRYCYELIAKEPLRILLGRYDHLFCEGERVPPKKELIF